MEEGVRTRTDMNGETFMIVRPEVWNNLLAQMNKLQDELRILKENKLELPGPSSTCEKEELTVFQEKRTITDDISLPISKRIKEEHVDPDSSPSYILDHLEPPPDQQLEILQAAEPSDALQTTCSEATPNNKRKSVKKRFLTLGQKWKVIQDAEKFGKSSRTIAKELNVGKTQIQKILSQKAEIEKDMQSNNPDERKRKSIHTENDEINNLIWKWFCEIRNRNIMVNGPQLQAKARQIADKLEHRDFKASNGWLQSFAKRHKISFKSIHANYKDANDAESSNSIRTEETNGYQRKSVFEEIFLQALANKRQKKFGITNKEMSLLEQRDLHNTVDNIMTVLHTSDQRNELPENEIINILEPIPFTKEKVQKKYLTLKEKMNVIHMALTYGKSARTIAKELNVGKSQIQNIIKNKKDIIEAMGNNTRQDAKRKGYRTENDEINNQTLSWYLNERSKNILVTGPQLQAKALQIADDLDLHQFKASNGWLQSFTKRHRISFKARNEESWQQAFANSDENDQILPILDNIKTEETDSNLNPSQSSVSLLCTPDIVKNEPPSEDECLTDTLEISFGNDTESFENLLVNNTESSENSISNNILEDILEGESESCKEILKENFESYCEEVDIYKSEMTLVIDHIVEDGPLQLKLADKNEIEDFLKDPPSKTAQLMSILNKINSLKSDLVSKENEVLDALNKTKITKREKLKEYFLSNLDTLNQEILINFNSSD